MEVQPAQPAEEIKRLQRCINDLVSVITLPATWTGGEPSQIVGTLLDVLLNILPLDLVYVRLKDPNGEPPIEIVRVAGQREPIPRPHEIGEVLNPWWGADPQIWPPRVRSPLGAGDLSIVPMRLGLQGEIGMIVAASPRADFPRQTERLVLSVAASQAAVGLQEARLLSEQRRVAKELDQKVEQRTRELSAANEELRKEITERERAEAARRHSEEQFRNVVDTATDAVVTIDETGQILYLNPAMTRIFGYSAAELIGHSLTILMPDYLREFHRVGFQRYLRTGKRHLDWQGVELTAVRKSGEEFPVEISFGEVASNSRSLFTGFIRDITERKQAEELRKARARLAAIRADVNHALTAEGELQGILQRCTEALVQHLNVAFARIWTCTEGAGILELQASAGMYTHRGGPHGRIPIGRLKIGMIAEKKRAYLTNAVVEDPGIDDKAWARKEGMVAFAGYPLVVDDRVVGVMAVFSRTPLADSVLDALAAAADSVAQGVERKRAEETLRKSEERFRLLVEGVQDYAIFMLDPEGRVVTWNEGAERVSGYCADEILGQHFARFYETGDRENGQTPEGAERGGGIGAHYR